MKLAMNNYKKSLFASFTKKALVQQDESFAIITTYSTVLRVTVTVHTLFEQ